MTSFAAQTDALSTPLADYFFIAGIESSRIFDGTNAPPSSPRLGETIDEDSLSGNSPTRQDSARGTPEAQHRRARLSYDPRKSMYSVLDYNPSPNKRNSAATTRPAKESLEGRAISPGFGDADFDQALRKFAAERDSFFEEIQFSAGQSPQPTRPRPQAKTQRMSKGEHKRENSHGSSLRRRISTMNPLNRQSTSTRRCECECKRPCCTDVG